MATSLPNGTFKATLRLPDGKRKVWRAPTEELAEAKKAAYLLANPQTPSGLEPSEGETLHDFAGFVWWPGIEASAKPNTIRKYGSDYKTHIAPDPMSRIPLAQLKHEHCQAFVGRLVKKKLSANSVRHVCMTVSTILNLAEKLDRIRKNPMRHVKKPKAPGKRKRSMDPAKVRDVLAAMDGPLSLAVLLSVVLGLREAEVCGLKWGDLDRIGRRLVVSRQRQDQKGGAIEVDGLKNGDASKVVALPSRLVEMIDSLGDLDSVYIVTNEDGGPMNPNALYKRWARKRGELGLAEWTYHDLRHAAAGLLHRGGTDLFTIRDTLGHSTLDMSAIYTDVADETQVAAISGVLEQVYGPVDRR